MGNNKYVTWEPDDDSDAMTPANLAHNRDILAYFSRFAPDNARVLDYGAGYCRIPAHCEIGRL